MAIELNNVSSGYSTGVINDNFQALEAYINNNLLNRDGTAVGEANQMNLPLDMNSFPILNAVTDTNLPGSLITVGEGDARYVNISGDTMEGDLAMAGNALTVRIPVADNEPSRKDQLDTERSERLSQGATIRSEYQAADRILQGQIDGLGVGGVTYVFSSLAALKVTEGLEVGQKVQTLGYYGIGDKGNNIYEIVAAGTGVEDGGSYIDLPSSGLQAKGLFPAEVNIFQFGSVSGGGFDNTASVQAAVIFSKKLWMGEEGEEFLLGSPVSIDSGITILSNRASISHPNNQEAFLLNSSDVSIEGLLFSGPDGSVFNTNSVSIRGIGTDNGAGVSPTFLTNIHIHKCEFTALGRSGVFLRYVKDSSVTHNKVTDTAYAGIEIQSGRNVVTSYNTIEDINLVQTNNYGIYFSRLNTADLVRDPVCHTCTASFNKMKNIAWEGLDCHGGIFLTFTHNTFDNCGDNNAAIALIHSDDEVSAPNYGVEHSVISMNTITGSQSYGLAFSSPGGGIVHKNNVITGNILFNCGLSAAVTDRGGINVGDTVNTLFANNSLEYCAPHGFVVKGAACNNVTISGNSMERIVSNALSTSSAVLLKRGVSGTGLVSVFGNTLSQGGQGETYDAEYGLRALDSEDGGGFEIGRNSFSVASFPYSVSLSLVDDFTQSPIQNYGNVTIAITTEAAFFEGFATLNNPHSGASVAKAVGSLLSSPDKNITVETAIISGTQVRFRLYTTDGANFSSAGNVTISYQTNGY